MSVKININIGNICSVSYCYIELVIVNYYGIMFGYVLFV